MKILQASGGLNISKLDKESMEVLIETAQGMIRAGVVFSPNDYLELNEQEREALIIANEKVIRERCAMIGMASNPIFAASLIGPEFKKKIEEELESKEKEKEAMSKLDSFAKKLGI